MNFFLEKQLIKFYVPISPFHSAKFKKNSQSRKKQNKQKKNNQKIKNNNSNNNKQIAYYLNH